MSATHPAINLLNLITLNLKPDWWGSPMVQEEKYQEKPVKREEKEEKELIIIIIITDYVKNTKKLLTT
jgi:hypothetical protein